MCNTKTIIHICIIQITHNENHEKNARPSFLNKRHGHIQVK